MILAIFGSHKYIPEKHPAIYAHLLPYKAKLENRGQCRYLSSGKVHRPGDKDYPGYPGMHHWLELDNNPRQEYMDDFSKQKIIWSDISTKPCFLKMDTEIYFNNTCYMLTCPPKNLLEYLNSDVVAWYLPNVIATDLGAGTRYFKQFVEQIPVPYKLEEDYNVVFGFTEEEMKFISSSVRP